MIIDLDLEELLKTENPEHVLIGDKELSKIINRSMQTLRGDRSRKKSLIPFIKIGGNINYRLSDVFSFLDTNTITQ
jgi:hypothetical protein